MCIKGNNKYILQARLERYLISHELVEQVFGYALF